MKLRKFAVLGVLSALLFSGCAPKEEEPEIITLKLGIQDAGYGVEHWDHIIETFEAEYPNVKVEMTADPQIGTLVSTLAQAGNDEEMFDLFQAYTPYAENGLLEPLDDLLEMTLPDDPSTKLKDAFYLNVADMILPEADGKIYRLPKAMYIGGMFYNKALFEQYGWDTNPQNWTEFLALMEDISADGIVPMTFAGIYNYLYFTVGWHKAFELAEAAGDLEAFNESFVNYGSNRFNNEYMVEVYDKIYQLGEKGYFDDGVAVLDHTQSQMQVIQGEVALVSSADWIDNEMKAAVPAGFEWGFMSIPMVDNVGDSIYLNAGASDSLVIWAGKPDENKEWAKKFLLWTYTVDAQKVTAEVATALPVTKGFYADEANMANLVSAQQSIFEYMNANTIVLATNFAIAPSDLDSEKMQMANTEFETNVPQICLANKTASEVLDAANAYYEEAIGD